MASESNEKIFFEIVNTFTRSILHNSSFLFEGKFAMLASLSLEYRSSIFQSSIIRKKMRMINNLWHNRSLVQRLYCILDSQINNFS